MSREELYTNKTKGKTVSSVSKKDGCLIIYFTDDTCIGIYNKAEIKEGSLDLGMNFYS